jgi:hypothetical protein
MTQSLGAPHRRPRRQPKGLYWIPLPTAKVHWRKHWELTSSGSLRHGEKCGDAAKRRGVSSDVCDYRGLCKVLIMEARMSQPREAVRVRAELKSIDKARLVVEGTGRSKDHIAREAIELKIREKTAVAEQQRQNTEHIAE